MFARTIFSGYLSLAVIVMFMRHVFRASAVQMVFGGLVSYYLIDPTKQQPAPAKAEDARSKKARKAAEKQQQLDIAGAAQQIYCTQLHTSLPTLPLADEINSLVTIGLSLLLNAVFVVLMAVVGGTSDTLMMISVSLLLVAYTCMVLLKADYASGSRKLVDQAVLGAVLGVGALVAFAALTWAPAQQVDVRLAGSRGWQRVPLMAWDVAKATRGFDTIVNGLHQRVSQRLQHQQQGVQPLTTQASPMLLAASVAGFAGVLAVAMLGPALRFSRLLYSSQQVPGWGDTYLRQSRWAIKAMQLAFVAPLLVTLSQVPALCVVWGIPTSQLAIWTGVLLLLAALTHCLCLRTLSQTYLNGGLTEWYTLLHNGYDYMGKLDVIRLRVDLLRSMLGKTGLQLMAPPLLALSMGLLLLLSGGTLEQLAARMEPTRIAAISRLPPALSSMLLSNSSSGAALPVNTTVSVSLAAAGVQNSSAGAVPVQSLLPGLDAAAASGPGSMAADANVTGLTDPSVPAAVASPAPVSADTAAGVVSEEALEGLTDDDTPVTIGGSTTASKTSSTSAKSRGPGKVAVSTTEPGDAGDLWQFLGCFLGWWACTTWSTYAVASLTVYRLGLNSG